MPGEEGRPSVIQQDAVGLKRVGNAPDGRNAAARRPRLGAPSHPASVEANPPPKNTHGPSRPKLMPPPNQTARVHGQKDR